MTALVAILNPSGIALATDSADTTTDPGTGETRFRHSTATKLFTLNDAVAVMFYGSGNYAGIPWPIIINAYKETEPTPKRTVKKTAQDFIDWLSGKLEEEYGLLALRISRGSDRGE